MFRKPLRRNFLSVISTDLFRSRNISVLAGDGMFMFHRIYLLYAKMKNKQQTGGARSHFLEQSLLQETTDKPQIRIPYESVPDVLVMVINLGKGYKQIHKICTKRRVASARSNTPKALAFFTP